MANVLIDENTMTSIGNAIRSKTGKTSKMLPAIMPQEILNISTGADVSGVTATPSEVLSGSKFVNSSGVLKTGTMPINSVQDIILNESRKTYQIPQGYHSGLGIVKLDPDMPAVGGNLGIAEVTLASDHSAQEWKTLCKIPYAGNNSHNDKLFIMLLRKDTTEITYSIPLIIGCNSAYLNSSYVMVIKRTSYGTSISYKPNAEDGYKLTSQKGLEISRICVTDTSGTIKIYPEKSYSFVAGTYMVVVGTFL